MGAAAAVGRAVSELPQNAGPYLTQHETDHHLHNSSLPGSHENEAGCSKISELSVLVLDYALARFPPPFYLHH